MAKIIFLIQREDIDPSRTVQQKVLFPVESAFAGALLKQAGHSIRPFDFNLKEDGVLWQKEFKQILQDFKPEFVISAPQTLTFLIKENRNDTIISFRLVKGFNDRVNTVYCGCFATSYPEQSLKESNTDYLIRGEYDAPLLSLVDCISSNKKACNIPGVISKNNYSNKINPVYTENIDFLPFPAYNEFNYKEYFKYPGRGNLRYAEYSRNYTHYQTSRGCPCGCCFCNVSFLRGGRKYRCRSLGLVLDDLEALNKQYGIEEIHFLDENLTVDRNRILKLCRGIVERDLNIKWMAACGLSIYPLDKEVLEWMWRAGCYRLNLAFESGSQEVLDNIIRKPVKLDRDIEKLKIVRDVGFETIGYFVIGLPGETHSQIRETIDLASSPFFDYVTISIATPQVGTKLEEMCIEQGLMKKDVCLADISRRSTGIFSMKEFSSYELEKIRWKQWDRINFSTDERKMRICKMMGISKKELEVIRKNTERDFKKRWRINT